MIKISAVLPSWGREELTLRILQAISTQTLEEFELFFLGDNCPVFEKIIKTKDFAHIKNILGDRLICFNFDTHDGTSAQAINYSMKNAKGEYFIFLSNDDLIFNNHFELYYQGSSSYNKDFNAFTTSIDYGNGMLVKRVPQLAPRGIGHSELCIKSDLCKRMPPHSRKYGHDWEFIQNCLNSGCTHGLFTNEPTYIVNLCQDREHNWEGGRLL